MTDTRVDPNDPEYRLRALIENAIGAELAAADVFVPLPLRERLARAVVAVLDEQFPPRLMLDPAPEISPEDLVAWQASFAEAIDGDAQFRVTVLPPSAPELWRRRTPAERRAYLETHRAEAVEQGIPADLIDLMIADCGEGGPL